MDANVEEMYDLVEPLSKRHEALWPKMLRSIRKSRLVAGNGSWSGFGSLLLWLSTVVVLVVVDVGIVVVVRDVNVKADVSPSSVGRAAVGGRSSG